MQVQDHRLPAAGLGDSLAVQVVAPPVIFFWTFIIVFPGFFLTFALFGVQKVSVRSLFPWVRNPMPYVKIGVLCYISYLLILFAYQGGGEVAAVNAVTTPPSPNV